MRSGPYPAEPAGCESAAATAPVRRERGTSTGDFSRRADPTKQPTPTNSARASSGKNVGGQNRRIPGRRTKRPRPQRLRVATNSRGAHKSEEPNHGRPRRQTATAVYMVSGYWCLEYRRRPVIGRRFGLSALVSALDYFYFSSIRIWAWLVIGSDISSADIWYWMENARILSRKTHYQSIQ